MLVWMQSDATNASTMADGLMVDLMELDAGLMTQ
jgi:hypothetical protein